LGAETGATFNYLPLGADALFFDVADLGTSAGAFCDVAAGAFEAGCCFLTSYLAAPFLDSSLRWAFSSRFLTGCAGAGAEAFFASTFLGDSFLAVVAGAGA
jgi:hypothetical protein